MAKKLNKNNNFNNNVDKDTKKYLKMSVKLLKPYLPKFIIILIFILFQTILNYITPYMIGEITNYIQVQIQNNLSIDLKNILFQGLILLLIQGVSITLSIISIKITQKTLTEIIKSLRVEVITKINKLPIKFFDKVSYGEVMSIINNDIESFSISLISIFDTSLISIMTLFLTMGIIFYINVKIALIVLAFLPISIILVIILRKRNHYYAKARQTEIGKISSFVEEVYSGQKIIQINNAQPRKKVQFDNLNDNLRKVRFKSNFYTGIMFPIVTFFLNIGFLVVAVYGGYLALSGAILIGSINTILIYIKRLDDPINEIPELSIKIQKIAVAMERISFIFDQEEDGNFNLLENFEETRSPLKLNGKITFKNVNFSYVNNYKVLEDINIDIKIGDKIAIVGDTGSGKSTIVNVLLNFYNVDSGEIFVDDVNIKDIPKRDLWDNFSVVLQDPWVFKGTIKENLIFEKKDISTERLNEVLKLTFIDQLVDRLPNGIDTIIDENLSISHGEKQLITIARAMLKDSSILIFDEATSSVDTNSEYKIQEALTNLMKNKTSIIIAHRLSTIKKSDKIIVIESAKIVEIGTHQELLRKKGKYYNLYNAQFL